jgi:hypothetical protein
MNKKQIVIHPFLFALYPVVSLLAVNLDQISPGVGGRAAVVLLSLTAVLFFVFQLLMKDVKKAGLAVTWMLFIIFSFKHFTNLLEGFVSEKTFVIVMVALLMVAFILLVIVPWVLWRFVKSSPIMLTTLLNVVALVILLFPMFQIISYYLRPPQQVASLSTEDPALALTTSEQTSLPDIYYIIVDGYGRSDVLEELYDFDNSPFLDNLTGRGFYVAHQSSSNYMQTFLSLASSLNFGYLDELADGLDDDVGRRDPLLYLIQNSQVRQILEEAGYETVIYDSDWPSLETYQGAANSLFAQTPEQNIESLGLNKFEALLWNNSIFSYLTPKNRTYDDHRQSIVENLDGVKSAATLDGPQFVIGHVIAPHPPFVFDADGNHIQPDHDYSIHDGNAFAGSRDEYISGYAGQIAHINTLLLQTVDHILAESEQPPIIIIQGDHGPGSLLDFDQLDNNSCFKERMSILNAYYFPDESYDALYQAITPVNSFRVVFNTLFHSELDLLPDSNYFSLWNTPYDFVDVTSEKDTCQLPGN